MKLFPNLAGSLRFYFGLARVLALLFGVLVWFLVLIGRPIVRALPNDHPKLTLEFGDVSIHSTPAPVAVHSDSGHPRSVELHNLRGTFQADLATDDPALASALRWTVLPSSAVLVAFSWLLFGALRNLCANIQGGEVFSENNLRLVRNSGLIMIAYIATAFVVQLWAAHVMNGYLAQHPALSDFVGSQFAGGAVRLTFSPTMFAQGGLVTGCALLLLSQVFKQGLNLKTENDLTV